MQNLKQSFVGESFIGALPQGAGERTGEQRKESRASTRLHYWFSHYYEQEVVWYHIDHLGSNMKYVPGFPSKGTFMHLLPSLIRQSPPHRESALPPSRLHLNSSCLSPTLSVSWGSFYLGLWWDALRLHLSETDQCPWIVWNRRLRWRHPTRSISCNTEVSLCLPLHTSPLLWYGGFIFGEDKLPSLLLWKRRNTSQIC